jgi:radical SAM superfamily enzyme YgiQ (UPF0313 family)
MTYDVVLFTGIEMPVAKPFGAFKCAHELRQAGFRTLVVSHLHWFNQQEMQDLLDQVIGDNTLFVGISNTFLHTLAANSTDQQYSTMSTARVATNNPRRDFKKEKDRYFPNFLMHFNHHLNEHALDEKQFVDYVKNINPNCKIVVGGTRTHPQMNNKTVDYAVLGYADVLVVDLAKHLRHGTPLNNTTKNIFGVHIVNDGGLAANFDFVNSNMIWTDDDVVVPTETLPIEISRGCIFKCKFCSYLLNGKKKLDYIKDYNLIKSELIRNYEKYNITAYRLLDDTFNDSEEKLDMMVDIVKSLPFRPVFWAYLRLDLVSKHPQTMQKLFDIGIKEWFFGIETFNLTTGRIIGKGYDPAEQIKTINLIKDTYGDQVQLVGSFIAGLPEESMESLQRTVDAIANNEIKLDMVRFNPLVILNHTELAHVWKSAFGLDMQQYGYSVDQDAPPNPNPNIINWKNNLTSLTEVNAWCGKIEPTLNAHQRNFFQRNPDRTHLAMHYLSNAHIGTGPEFVQKYKAQLFNYLTNTQSHVQS